jgi:hypothetical protein
MQEVEILRGNIKIALNLIELKLNSDFKVQVKAFYALKVKFSFQITQHLTLRGLL